MKNIKKILFVCTGNSCRSIMGEAYFKKRAGEEGLDLEVRSAGTIGIDGLEPSENTLLALKEEGIGPEGLESNRLTKELVEWADLILVMEETHGERVGALVPGAKEKTRPLREFGGERITVVPDPIGRTIEYYRMSMGIIKRSVEGLIKWLKG